MRLTNYDTAGFDKLKRVSGQPLVTMRGHAPDMLKNVTGCHFRQ
jgi:hypothetical protein